MNKNIQFFLILFHDVHSSAVMDVTSKAKFFHSWKNSFSLNKLNNLTKKLKEKQ